MKLLGVTLALLAAGQSASDLPTLKYSPEELEQADARELATKVFGPGAQTLTESAATRIPGVVQWQGINVNFASAPQPTGFDGLCGFDAGQAYFRWHRSEGPSDSDYVELASAQRSKRYSLLTGAPKLNTTVANEDACSRLTSVLNKDNPHDIIVQGSGGSASPEQTVYALRALMTAKKRAPEARSFDLTRVYSIEVGGCGEGDQSERCVSGWIDLGREGVELKAAVDALPSRDWSTTKPRVRSAKIVSHLWPVF